MKYINFLTTTILSLSLCLASVKADGKFSFLTYIQADNDLAPFANYNVRDMQKVGSTSNLNILVQWDKTTDNITYRYKILQNNMVENDSINKEMGFNPAKEIVDCMKWVHKNYAADRYALILWDHGNGVLDRNNKKKRLHSWLAFPGLSKNLDENRGILYDYSQDTFLDNRGLSSACSSIKTTLNQKIDLLGMDACLMAMIEIAYQVRKSVSVMTASQQTEPGFGWPYTEVLSPLAGMPSLSTADFATIITEAYANYYTTSSDADSSFTLSAIDVTKITSATTAFNRVLDAIIASQEVDPSATNSAIKNARRETTSFYISDYIDLVNFYDNLSTEFSALSSARSKKNRLNRSKASQAAANIVSAIATAKQATLDAIIASKIGSDYNGKAYGLSIYYPANGKVDSSYLKTDFAKNTKWTQVLKTLKS